MTVGKVTIAVGMIIRVFAHPWWTPLNSCNVIDRNLIHIPPRYIPMIDRQAWNWLEIPQSPAYHFR